MKNALFCFDGDAKRSWESNFTPPGKTDIGNSYRPHGNCIEINRLIVSTDYWGGNSTKSAHESDRHLSPRNTRFVEFQLLLDNAGAEVSKSFRAMSLTNYCRNISFGYGGSFVWGTLNFFQWRGKLSCLRGDIYGETRARGKTHY